MKVKLTVFSLQTSLLIGYVNYKNHAFSLYQDQPTSGTSYQHNFDKLIHSQQGNIDMTERLCLTPEHQDSQSHSYHLHCALTAYVFAFFF